MSAAPHLIALAEVLRARVRRDECGDSVIIGRRGSVHGDGQGFSVAVMLDTPRQWTAAKAKLQRFCQVRQDGDSEGVVFMAAVPDAAGCALLRDLLRIPQLRRLKPETRTRLIEAGARFRFGTGQRPDFRTEKRAICGAGHQTIGRQQDARSGGLRGGG